MPISLDPASVRHGRARGRYFRENFAQGGFDLVQVLPEVVTNADAAIAASGTRGRIDVRFGPPRPDFVADWKRELRRLGVRGLPSWKNELTCTDNGEGVNADVVDARLGALGVVPERGGQRGLFGRGLRDVWLAQGGGRIQGVRDGRLVESWFFPAPGDEPYAYVHVRDHAADAEDLLALGLATSGTRVTVPLPGRRLPANGRLRSLVAQLVQLRPVLEDPAREVWLELPGEPAHLVRYPAPEPDPDRPVLFEGDIDVMPGVAARVVVRRAVQPIPLSPVRALRRGGLVVRSGRAAHEVTLVGMESLPGARHLFGEVSCEAIEDLQREALDSVRPQLVVRADRSGLNEHHPLVQRLSTALERVLRPIIDAEERRAGAHLVRAGRALRARDEVGLRELNDALRTAFDAPGSAGFRGGDQPSQRPQVTPPDADDREPVVPDGPSPAPPPTELTAPIRFKQALMRMHPGEQRGASLIFDPARIAPGTKVDITTERGVAYKLWSDVVPEPNRRGWSRLTGTLRARATVAPGSRVIVVAEAAGFSAELEIVVVRHRGSGWVREIARKDEDSSVEAHFDPESGIVTVFEGRREFRALERAARRAGLSRKRVHEYLPYRMLEVEAASNAVYQWAAERILERRLVGERPADPVEYAKAVRLEAQGLRHAAHERLMRAFLEPEVFDGGVRVEQAPALLSQPSLLEAVS